MIVQLVKMVTAITIGLIVYSAVPYVEGYFFPVLTNVRINDIQPVGGYNSRVSITYDKIRNCNFIQLQTFYGNPWNDFVAVDSDLVNEPNPTDRPVGTYTVLLDIELPQHKFTVRHSSN